MMRCCHSCQAGLAKIGSGESPISRLAERAYSCTVANRANRHAPRGLLDPLSIEQLEAGLRIMDSKDGGLRAFWDENIAAFRQTVLFAISETSETLRTPFVPLDCRIELERQLEDLIRYIELADRYIARRTLNFERAWRGPRLARNRLQ